MSTSTKATTVAAFLFAITALAAEPKTLRLRLSEEPQTLDWNLAHTDFETWVLGALMRGLVRFESTPRGLNVVPDLAQSWKRSSDGKVITFKIKPHLKWSDGKPVLAQQWVDSWERLLNPLTAAPYAYFLFDVVGAEDYQSGKLKDFAQVGVKAIEPLTLEVRLREPVSFWEQMTGFWVTFPVRKELILQDPKRWTEPSKLVTLGDYRLEERKTDSKLVLVSSGLRPKANQNSPDRVEFQIVKDDQTAVNLYRAGKIDFLSSLPSLQIEKLKSGNDYFEWPYLRVYFVGLNVQSPGLSDVALRKALAHAIDRSQLSRLLRGGQKAAKNFVPPPLLGSNPIIELEFSEEKAKRFMAQAKRPQEPLNLICLNSETSTRMAEFLQAQWKKVLGIEIRVVPYDNKTFRPKVNAHQFDLAFLSWSADYPDPDNFLSMFIQGSGNNRANYKSTAYDALIKTGRRQLQAKVRAKAYEQAQRLLQQQDVGVLPLYYQPHAVLLNSRVKGLKLNELNQLDLVGVTLE